MMNLNAKKLWMISVSYITQTMSVYDVKMTTILIAVKITINALKLQIVSPIVKCIKMILLVCSVMRVKLLALMGKNVRVRMIMMIIVIV